MSHVLVDSQVLHRNGKLQEAEVAYKRAYTGPWGSTSMDIRFFMAKEWGASVETMGWDWMR
jgi:hypothetical protein